MDLYLLRHADAGDPEAWGGPDEARPLSAKGRRQSERLGAYLAAIGFRVEVILSSPKLRALETARIVAEALGTKTRVDERLAAGLTMEAADSVVAEHDSASSAMLVGHDPDFSDLLAELCGAPGLRLRKGAIARLELDRPFSAGSATLRWLIPPDALRKS